MKQTNEIIIRAPLKKIFTAASDLSRWPEFLPHYRYNRFLSHTPSGGIVQDVVCPVRVADDVGVAIPDRYPEAPAPLPSFEVGV